MTRFALLLVLLAFLVNMVFASDTKAPRPMSSNLISGSVEELLEACRADIAWTKAEIEKLKSTKKPAAASALAAFDTAVLRLSDVLSRSGLAEQVLPAKEG